MARVQKAWPETPDYGDAVGTFLSDSTDPPAAARVARSQEYGQLAWNILNSGINAYSAMPKRPWNRRDPVVTKSGDWIMKERRPKITQLQFVLAAEWLADNSEYGDPNMHQLLTFMAEQFADYTNRALLSDDYATARSGKGVTPLGWLISNRDEAALEESNHGLWDDVGMGRSGECTVVSPGGTLDTRGRLSRRTFLDAMEQSRANGGDVGFMVGSHAALGAIQEISDPSQVTDNAIGEALIEVGVGGVGPATGRGVAIQVPSMYGVPFLTVDWAGDRIFGIDSTDGLGGPRMSIGVAVPPTYSEAGFAAGSDGAYAGRGAYWTRHELCCNRFCGQFKIRDIEM